MTSNFRIPARPATFLLLAFAAACAERTPAPTPDAAAIDTTVLAADADSARALAVPDGCDELADHFLAVQPVRSELLATLGPPDSIASRTQENRHTPGVVDTLFDVFYPGLHVSIHTPGGGADLPSRVVVRDNRYLAYPRIGIGAAADSVIAVLGEPAPDGDDVLSYNCTMVVDQPVRFHLADGRVARITIEYYVD
ncbi:MAG TPA: hypothetical protein VFZ24_04235 [Longimicrobiales bacterium]